jgi:hypothetical protein
MFRFTKLKNFYSDIRNFLYIRSIVRKNRGTADWERFNLRVDYIYRIYTVFNPSEQDKGDDPKMLEIKQGERMIPCHKYIDSIGLSEVIGVSGEKIPDSDSYLIVYYQLFNYITPWKIFINTVYITLIAIFHSPIWHFLTKAINWVTGLF